MYELKKIGKLLTSKSIGTGHSSYEKRIYRAVVSQRLRKTGLTQRVHVHLTNAPVIVDCKTYVLRLAE